MCDPGLLEEQSAFSGQVSTEDVKKTIAMENSKDRNIYRIVADNFDMSIKARQQTKGHGNQSIHWAHQFAVEDRVKTPYTLEELQPQYNPKDLPLSQLLLNNDIQE